MIDLSSKDLADKVQWEELLVNDSLSRMEKNNRQKLDDLLQQRKREMDSLIRKNIAESRHELAEDGKSRIIAHKGGV